MSDTAAAASEPVVLVGHSMAGVVISGIAERMPERIRLLVYLTAYLPRNGECLSDLVQRDTESRAKAERIQNGTGECFRIRDDSLHDAFYQDADADTLAFVSSHLVAEPTAMFRTPVALSAAGFGSVSRAYILCRKDRAVTPAFQRQMLADSPCNPVLEIDSGHSPFLTQPRELTALLASLV